MTPRRSITILTISIVLAAGLGFMVGRAVGSGDAAPMPEWDPDSPTPRPVILESPDDSSFPETIDEMSADYEVAPGLDIDVIDKSQVFNVTVYDHESDGDLDVLVLVHNTGDDPLWLRSGGGFDLSNVALPWQPNEDWRTSRDRHACTAGDVDLDGDPDLYCALGAGSGMTVKQNELWLQDEGDFSESFGNGAEDASGRGRAAAFFNLDGDAYPDLYVANALAERADDLPNINRVYLNNGDLTFTEVATVLSTEHGANCNPAVGDWNRDGFDDFAICPQDPEAGFLYEADGQGDFVDITGQALPEKAATGRISSVKLIDLDGDGWLDLVVIRPTQIEVFSNTPDSPGTRFGNRVHQRKMESPVDAAAADLNGDSILDLYVVDGGDGCSWAAYPPWNGHDIVLLGPDYDEEMEAPYTQWGCGHLAVAVGGDEILVVNGRGRLAGPITVVRPAG